MSHFENERGKVDEMNKKKYNRMTVSLIIMVIVNRYSVQAASDTNQANEIPIEYSDNTQEISKTKEESTFKISISEPLIQEEDEETTQKAKEITDSTQFIETPSTVSDSFLIGAITMALLGILISYKFAKRIR